MTYNYGNPDDWPYESFAGRERLLADLMNDDTMEFYETMTETDDDEFSFAGQGLYTMLMMHTQAAHALAHYTDYLDELILGLKNDARDESGEYFTARMNQRVELRETLRRLGKNLGSE